MTKRTNIPILILVLASTARAAQNDNRQGADRRVFEPGRPWLDTSGKPIQAHGGGILFKDGVFYWYGEEKTHGNLNKIGVACYSSRDLYNWKPEGVVLRAEVLPKPFRGDHGICERPKVLHNEKNGTYVMWMHLDDEMYHTSVAGVATADAPTGPFRYVAHFRPIKYDFGATANDPDRQHEEGGTFRDMNLFRDDDRRAYVFYASEGNRTMYVVRLNADYTGPESPPVEGKTWGRILVNKMREAPAPFRYRETYYLITSACTAWGPNAASYAIAKSILGPYETRKNPCVGPGADKTFRSQSTFVLPVPGRPGCFIYMGDRWNPSRLGDSTYVWLPFRIRADGAFTIEWRDRWDLSVFDAMESADSETRDKPFKSPNAMSLFRCKALLVNKLW